MVPSVVMGELLGFTDIVIARVMGSEDAKNLKTPFDYAQGRLRAQRKELSPQSSVSNARARYPFDKLRASSRDSRRDAGATDFRGARGMG
jgi:hypothetical protein